MSYLIVYNYEMDYKKEALKKHKQLKGKISIKLKDNLSSVQKLSTYYTPGVGVVSEHLSRNPKETPLYTWTNNCVAVISDGSAVLGLGNVGPEAALPVMEGKAMLFKHFAQINAVPIVIDVHTVDEIVRTVEAIAPSFGAINLEDIAAPICFEVERRLIHSIEKPIMHDDQHGTAVVVLAGLINAMRVTKRDFSKTKIVVSGAGAAGTAIVELIYKFVSPHIIVVDSKGIVNSARQDLNEEKKYLLKFSNPENIEGILADSLKGADVFLGVSKAGLLSTKMIKTMSKDPIIFAMANPDPEIMPGGAIRSGAAIVATGRSDFPNQINNALAFPGIFRGALDNKVNRITTKHKIAAAKAIASLVKNPSAERIVPTIQDKRIVPAIAEIML